MADEVIEYLAIDPDGIYADLTAGLGGHSARIAAALSPRGRLICRDRDGEALEMARQNLAAWAGRITFDRGTISEFPAALSRLGSPRVSGLLADLGVSLYQLKAPERGFSFREDGPLDMRMSKEQDLTAYDIVNYYSERELADLIYKYGEERRARRIARAILRARPVSSTLRLATLVEQALPREGKLHPATLTFQSLRIAVNDELGEVESLVKMIPTVVVEGGRVVVITFHSLEDRIVKRGFQELARGGRAQLLNKHVVTASAEELRRNLPSRSAKLRALRVL
jgi:16S rRNA (cytosine1402-N4)-methyltransferase